MIVILLFILRPKHGLILHTKSGLIDFTTTTTASTAQQSLLLFLFE